MLRRKLRDAGTSLSREIASLREQTAIRLLLETEKSIADIANAVLFLASAGGAYITGETLHVNGGMLMD